jgi:hypothetical protein
VFGKDFDATPVIASSSLIASYVIGVFTLAGWIISSTIFPDPGAARINVHGRRRLYSINHDTMFHFQEGTTK